MQQYVLCSGMKITIIGWVDLGLCAVKSAMFLSSYRPGSETGNEIITILE